ncbi:hypothetical protein NKI77_06025 [Mesorhizobium opportunistum]|uniref:Uncharacterized protein n=1 Tax=Mesorhizobium opportunistum TaxID=593909 RepID=A0ABV1YAR9_9HYPH|nr:hypothetical protein [Mesorhizobium sp.]TIN91137.1 MAG: hypothetical protein E5Y06_29060 [Mesorhizobium sp.]TJU94294.1 MAG: hypothetical protein E5Y08_30450 [Mesorhizobium sp.]TJU98305.1 MAG: hypothetical protein E5Y12_23930 [Mesorhizobium sp.]TJV16741.1 MAG: hypothetical protein E5Y07_15945 [Mesorhizobium sp.]TJV45466.1 MAG: hypothetical protein E5Y02_03855 [Mesorhizobium sp.]
MNRLTKYAAAAVLAVSGTVAAAATSNAMPIVSVTKPAAPALVEHVRWGCGIGWHPNRWGRCVPNRVVVRPFIVGPGYHVWHPHRHWHRWHRHW